MNSSRQESLKRSIASYISQRAEQTQEPIKEWDIRDHYTIKMHRGHRDILSALKALVEEGKLRKYEEHRQHLAADWTENMYSCA